MKEGRPPAIIPILACYPITVDNPLDNCLLPTGKVVPHMQTGSDAPLFTDPVARYPVVAFSHGYSGSPISSDYISGLSVFARYGYVVIAPFHGDLRFSDLKIDDLSDAIAVALHLDNFTALQALRPLSISAALDLVLAHPQWQGHIDATQIGGFGASMGGETMMLLGGALDPQRLEPLEDWRGPRMVTTGYSAADQTSSSVMSRVIMAF